MRAVSRRAIAFILLSILAAPAADAKGIIRVQETNRPMQTYSGVVIHVVKGVRLTIRSADGKGVLTFDDGACSFVGEVRRCYLYGATLDQGGATRPLDINSGTLYVNLTGATQPLPLTSQRLAPNELLMALRTRIGTIITVTGTIDSVASR
jgi:hypothetical protein